MPYDNENIEYNFNFNDHKLIHTGDDLVIGAPVNSYLRIAIFTQDDEILTIDKTNITIPQSSNQTITNPIDNRAIFYQAIGNTYGGSDFLDTEVGPNILIIPTTRTSDEIIYDFTVSNGEFSQPSDLYRPPHIEAINLTTFSGTEQSIFVKINELFRAINLPTDNYKVKFDFLKQFQYRDINGDLENFVIREISPSRREVRLKLKNSNIAPVNWGGDNVSYTILDELPNEMGSQESFEYKHVLCLNDITNVPILNYTFDRLTDGDGNQSIILKLYDPLPLTVGELDIVTIEKEVKATQTEEIYYISDVEAQTTEGSLPPSTDTFSDFTEEDIYQNYNELSSSTPTSLLDNIISGYF